VQLVAFDAFQLNVAVPFAATLVGVAVNVSVGAGAAVTVTVVLCIALPPLPVQLNV
jgi:hypothetical protein